MVPLEINLSHVARRMSFPERLATSDERRAPYMLKPMCDLIPKAVGRSGIGQSMYAANVVTVVVGFFDQLLGDASKQFKVISYKDGILTVDCLNSVIANEIAQSEDKCRAFLRKKVPRAKLKTIRTKLTDELESW
jgi:hypothetical protein